MHKRIEREKHITHDSFSNKPERLVYLMPPHAPSVITTYNPQGKINLGVFEQTMLTSNDPAVVLVGISPKSDTLYNLRDTGECVIGFFYEENIDLMYSGGIRLPREESELDVIEGFNPKDSHTIKTPSLLESWLSLEGTLLWEKETGDHVVCAIEIQHVVLDEEYWHTNPKTRRGGVPHIYYSTNGEFYLKGRKKQVSQED